MRAAAALVSARAVPTGQAGPRSLWDLLPAVAPELDRVGRVLRCRHPRHPSLAGSVPAVPGQITAREADDLLRQAETFVEPGLPGLLGAAHGHRSHRLTVLVAATGWA